jgi:hypothetical protein
MNNEITVNNSSEFQAMLDNKDFKISQIIVDSILKNLDSPKTNIYIMSINCFEEDVTYDITLDKKYFKSVLEENLKHFIKQEQYEMCSKIVEVINNLKEN